MPNVELEGVSIEFVRPVVLVGVVIELEPVFEIVNEGASAGGLITHPGMQGGMNG